MEYPDPTGGSIPIPGTLKDRPFSKRGFLVPWFVPYIDGEPDFRILDSKKLHQAIAEFRCWMCGGSLRPGMPYVFVVGPMCIANHIGSEPPCHPECARYAARACPFLTRPHAKRRKDERTQGSQCGAGGVGIERNPGVVALAFVRSFQVEQVHNGIVFRFDKPIAIEWFCQGRNATRDEVMHSIDTGLPEVRAISDLQGPKAAAAFERSVHAAMRYVPRV